MTDQPKKRPDDEVPKEAKPGDPGAGRFVSDSLDAFTFLPPEEAGPGFGPAEDEDDEESP